MMKKLWEDVFMAFVLKCFAAITVACGLLVYLHRPVTPEAYWRVILTTALPAVAITMILAVVLAVRSWRRE